jgi:hypothetical protein
MGPHPEAQMRVDALKTADHSGYQQIIRPSRGMQAGLKILGRIPAHFSIGIRAVKRGLSLTVIAAKITS